MVKLFVLLVIGFVVFILTQFIIFYLSDRRPKFSNKFHRVLLYNIEICQIICTKIELNCILVDKPILKKLLHTEKLHRELNRHDHIECNYFCKKSSTVFLVDGNNLDDKFSEFQLLAQKYGFLVNIQKGPDSRQESLEVRKGHTTLIYHIFLTKNTTTIHFVISYPRFHRHWTFKCEISKKIIFLPISRSLFCNSQHVFNFFSTTTALIDGVYVKIPQNLPLFLKEIDSSTYQPCNYEQARSFYSINGYDSTDDSDIFRSKAKQILEITIDELGLLNIPFWLSSGTCLGWFRQCDFIPYSKDVDIGIRIINYNEKLISAFQKRGLILKHRFGKIADSFELSFQMNDVKLDIFFFYEEYSNIWNGGTQVKTGKKFKYIFPKFSLCWSDISNLLVRVPCTTRSYIEANYGKNWNIPVEAWDWKASPPNVQTNGEWPVDERNDVIKIF